VDKPEETQISITQNGDPKENALAERLNGILKAEVYEESYPDFKTATQAIETATSIYNHFRPHSRTGHIRPRQLHFQKDTKTKKL